MKYRWLAALCLSFASLLATPAQTKQTARQPSNSPAGKSQPNLAGELKEAQATADRFTRRLRESRDLTPLVAEMFTSDFKQTIGQDDSWSGTVGIGRSLTEHLNAEERQRCYLAAFNLRYFMRLYIAGRISLDAVAGAKSEDLLPPELFEFFKNHAAPEELVETTEQARKHLANRESAAALMRKGVTNDPPEETAQFKRNLADFAAHLQQYKEEQPWVRVLDKADQFGHPAGTWMARFIIPFHVGLLLVKEKGEYKVWLAMTDLPPD